MREIVWEKWQDPFKVEPEEIEATLAEEEDAYNMSDVEFMENEHRSEIIKNINDIQKRKIDIIQTPFGILPVTTSSLMSTHFNFWTGYTNFRLTKPDMDIISGTDGVEGFERTSDYRFRIVVGKLFRASQVFKDVQLRVCKHSQDIMFPMLSSKYAYWIVFKGENGQKHPHGGESREFLEEKCKIYANKQGTLYKSWELS